MIDPASAADKGDDECGAREAIPGDGDGIDFGDEDFEDKGQRAPAEDGEDDERGALRGTVGG